MKALVLGTLAYVIVSFVVQAVSHFGINRTHYGSIPFARTEPIAWMGVLVLIIQGVILSHLYGYYAREGSTPVKGLVFGLLIGMILVLYIAVVEPSKYTVPSILSWMTVEGVAGILQFALFGLVLGSIYRRSQPRG